MAYSEDLRARVWEACEVGESPRAVARRFSVSHDFVYALLRHVKKTKSLKPLPMGGDRRSQLKEYGGLLCQWISEQPDITRAEMRERLEALGVKIQESGLSKWLKRLGFTYKKKHYMRMNEIEETSP